MQNVLAVTLDVFWHIIQYVWHAITWFFHLEERLLINFDSWGWPTIKQILFISPINAVVIAWDIFFFYNLSKIKRVLRLVFVISAKKTPVFIRRVLRKVWSKTKKNLPTKLQNLDKDQLSKWKTSISSGGKIFTNTELGILALIPECQKVACFVFATRPAYFGWRGYLVLCLAGTIRLSATAYLPQEIIWVLIILAIAYRVFRIITPRNSLLDETTKKYNREGKR